MLLSRSSVHALVNASEQLLTLPSGGHPSVRARHYVIDEGAEQRAEAIP